MQPTQGALGLRLRHRALEGALAGRNGLIDLLGQWQQAGVNHAALGIQFSQRPAAEVLQELAEYVLPLFPSHEAPVPPRVRW